MRKLTTAVTTLAGIAAAPLAMAHAGHDHGHWLSDPIHALTAAAIASVIVVGAAVVGMRRAKAERLDSKRQDK